MLVVGNGCSGAYLATLSTNIKNFDQKHRGKVVGSLLALYGISSAIFSATYTYILHQNLQMFLLFCAIATGSIPLLGVVFMNVVPPPDEKKKVIFGSIQTEDEEVPDIPVMEEIVAAPTESKKRDDGFADLNPIQTLLTLDFAIYMVMFLFAVGTGQMIINNLGSVVIAYGGKDGDQGLCYLK
jgi:hypothetical protein